MASTSSSLRSRYKSWSSSRSTPETTTLWPGRDTTRDSASSSRSASRIGMWLTPSRLTRSRTTIGAPGASDPERISLRSLSATCWERLIGSILSLSVVTLLISRSGSEPVVGQAGRALSAEPCVVSPDRGPGRPSLGDGCFPCLEAPFETAERPDDYRSQGRHDHHSRQHVGGPEVLGLGLDEPAQPGQVEEDLGHDHPDQGPAGRDPQPGHDVGNRSREDDVADQV